jgi:hypothetical protein
MTTVTIETAQNVPSMEEWIYKMENSSREDALRMCQFATDCLYVIQSLRQQDQLAIECRWSSLIGIAERVLKERGIPRDDGES